MCVHLRSVSRGLNVTKNIVKISKLTFLCQFVSMTVHKYTGSRFLQESVKCLFSSKKSFCHRFTHRAQISGKRDYFHTNNNLAMFFSKPSHQLSLTFGVDIGSRNNREMYVGSSGFPQI